MMLAIVILVLATLVAVAIASSSISSRDGSRATHEDSATQELARSASTVLGSIYSSLASGEYDGFVPTEAVLRQYASMAGTSATVVSNRDRSVPVSLQTVDNRIPANRQFTVNQATSDGLMGHWQLYSLKLPTWGFTKTGRVVTYVRTWTTSSTGVPSKAAVYRLDFRPTWFADFQMLFDGPVQIGDGATINGRVHSNGYATSFYNSFGAWGSDRVRVGPLARCNQGARISSSYGTVVPGPCSSSVVPGHPPRINILRARDLARSLRAVCESGPKPGLQMTCPRTPATERVVVRLSTSGNVQVSSSQGTVNLNSNVGGDRPDQNQGAVVVLTSDATISGRLGPRSRAMIVLASPATTATVNNEYGSGPAPSAFIESGGDIGADPSASSSFGIVAEGDVVLDETRACGVTYRGALLTMTGVLSTRRTWRIPLATPGGYLCNASVNVEGSITGHFPPALYQAGNAAVPGSRAGYARRAYTYKPSLYDNPPPAYPTASDWELTSFAPANLDCFLAAGTLDTSKAGCI